MTQTLTISGSTLVLIAVSAIKPANTNHFPDEHFRLGFEDFPISYPIVFDEFLFSKEMFEEYFSKDNIKALSGALQKKETKIAVKIIAEFLEKISLEKALYEDFVIIRIVKIIRSEYVNLYT
jgi:hypothetical protein